jgi:hypothetical protein
MCVVSMVHDHYDPLIPQPYNPQPWPPAVPGDNSTTIWFTPPPPKPPYDPEETQRLIELFKRAKEAAETVDKLTGQPDCVDPKKAELEKRVKQLEEEIAMLKRIQALEAEAAELRKKIE